LSIAEQRAVGFIPAWSLASLHLRSCSPKWEGKEDSQIGFFLGTVEYNVCDLQSEDSIPSISSQKSEVVLESCNNIACNKTTSFKIPVTLWIYGKKVQTEALVDLGATTNFVDRVVVENNNLVMHKLAKPYHVINVNGTPNKAGQITEYV